MTRSVTRNRLGDTILERQILVTYRLDPELAARLVPFPVRPQTLGGCAVAGMSLVRLGFFGRGAVSGSRIENATHRIAVQWDVADQTRYGMWVARRDTSWWGSVPGAGRLFPAQPHHARFEVEESPDHLRVAYTGRHISVETELDVVPALTGSRLFADLDAASRFLHRSGGEIDRSRWAVEAAAIRHVHSSWFDDRTRFPFDSLTLDCAIVLRRMPIRWVGAPSFARALLAGSRIPLPAA